MKKVAIIQARMGSTRLANKVMLCVGGRALLEWMLERVSLSKNIDEVVVATTTLPEDDVITNLSTQLGYKVFRGSSEDVLDRYYRAAKSVNADIIVRLTADCPLIDPGIIDQLVDMFCDSNVDFLSNSEPLPSSWPDGMDVSIFGSEVLNHAWEKSILPSEREHVTFYFWNNQQGIKCKKVDHIYDWSRYRLTIDYPEDFLVIKSIISDLIINNPKKIGAVSMNEIINYLDANPSIYMLNNIYTRGLGWESSFQKDAIVKAGLNEG